MTVAFVLQGGGGLAATQVGQLRALREYGITPDLVVGTSSGAINSVAFAQDPTEEGLDRMERLWTGLRPADVFPMDVVSLITSLPTLVTGLFGWHDGLLSPKRLRRLLEHMLTEWEQREEIQSRVAVLELRRRRSIMGSRLFEATPRAVLLHTLAHLLMRRLAFSCGYSSASLRERVYAETTPRSEAGLLVYTAAGEGL